MDIFFNELSVYQPSSDHSSAKAKMKAFVLCYTEANKKGFNRIRTSEYIQDIELSDDYTMHDWATDKDVKRKYRELILGSLSRPFIKDEDEDEIDSYLEGEYYFEENGYDYPKEICYGLAAAILYNSISISLESHDVWKQTYLNVSKKRDDEVENISVLNVINCGDFKSDEICNFLYEANLYKLKTTKVKPENKEVKLSGDHHGNY